MKSPRRYSQALFGAFVLFSFCAPSVSQSGSTPTASQESPVGFFSLYAPSDPPSGPPQVTPMVFLDGPYEDLDYLPGSTVDMTMDESGKILAISQVPGFEDKKQGTEVVRTLFVRTVNGLPVLTANASAGGTYDDGTERETKGKGKAALDLGTARPPENDFQEVDVMSSFSGKQDKESDKEKPHMDTLFLDAQQLNGLVEKFWYLDISLVEYFDSKNQPYIVATVKIFKPDGFQTCFEDKEVTYSATGGYSFSLSKGGLFDEFGDPVLDSNGRHVIDKHSQVTFSNLLFKKLFDTDETPYWEPAAGGISFKFLGQNGFGHVFNFDTDS